MSIETIIDPDADIRSALAEAAAFDDTPAPVATDWARAALDAYYGLDQAPEAVPGSRHAAFRVVLDDGSAGVLQVSHPDADPVAVDFQTQALLHVGRADPGLPVQRIVPARDGATSLWLADDAGRARLVRLLTRLDGPPMSDAAVSDAAAVPVARTLARLHRALSGLWHPGGEKSLPGDLRRADRLRPLLGLLPDDDGQALAHAALDDFERRARALLPALRQQPIHNGLTRDRLLADPAAPGRIVGILGFDRMVEAPLVADLAVALSDWIDPAPGDDDATRTLARIAGFAAAYHAVAPLQDIEMMLLPDLLRTRLAMDLAIGGWRATRQGVDASWLHRRVAGLQALGRLSHQQAHESIAAACNAVHRSEPVGA